MKTRGTIALILLAAVCTAQSNHPTIAIGSAAPDFNLPAVDGKTYSLSSFGKARIICLIFTCNHCPTAQAYELRIKELVHDYSGKGVQVVAINPNNPDALRLDELGWSDVGDGLDDMKQRARDKSFNFPYLYDGELQATASLYGPVATPHVFLLDEKRVVRYTGRIDDQENPAKTPNHHDTREAIEALLSGKEPPAPTKVFGCSVKWIEKSNWIDKAKETWAKQPVTVTPVDVAGIKELLKNTSGNLRMINVWATWCGPCVVEFPSLINLQRIYQERDFEFVTISADDPANQEKVLKFLKKQQASGANYLFNEDDKYKLMDAIDPKWQGALPYTLLVEPGGKIVYTQPGAIDPGKLRQVIFDDPLIGRLFKQ